MDQNHQAELARASSDMLPLVITTVANISLFLGVIAAIYALVSKELWLLTPSLSSCLAAPFLYGFSDIVRSLRTVALKSLKG